MKFTAAERRFARRVLRTAAARAERRKNPFLNQQELWKLMVQAASKRRTP